MGNELVIIGAGMAGLSAGCYAQMNGYQSHIYDMHAIPGGMCTAWKRKGYTFDASIHILFGSSSGMFHDMWRELGVIQGRAFVNHELMMRIETMGRSFNVPSNLDELERGLISLSPDDTGLIKELIGMCRKMVHLDMPMYRPRQLFTAKDYLELARGMLPLLGIMRRGATTLQGFAAEFKDPFVGEVVRSIIDQPGWPMPEVPLMSLLVTLGASHARNLGTPLGGSIAVAQTIAKRYRELGGKLHFNARVDKILVENDRAVGVRLADGTVHRADAVVSAADGRSTIWKMLDGEYQSAALRKAYAEWKVYPPLVQVMMGVSRDLSKEPRHLLFDLPSPIMIAGEVRKQIDVLHYCHDPSMAPAGKTVAQVWYPTRYDYWEMLARDRSRYEAEKKLVADQTIAALDKRWPGFASEVEVVDVPTPVTYERYTGNWQGSPDGWCMTKANMGSEMPRELPGLKGFYMAGQWVIPFSGVPGAATSGCHAIQLLCHADHKKFVRTVPASIEPVSAPEFHDEPASISAAPRA